VDQNGNVMARYYDSETRAKCSPNSASLDECQDVHDEFLEADGEAKTEKG
jgi:hypothetical protein